jgi:hypothetical protein
MAVIRRMLKRSILKKTIGLILLIAILSTGPDGFCQAQSYPDWGQDSLKTKGLDKKYELAAYLKPGAGANFGSGGNDFSWAGKWYLYTKRTAQGTLFDKKSGDIVGGRPADLLDRKKLSMDTSGRIES